METFDVGWIMGFITGSLAGVMLTLTWLWLTRPAPDDEFEMDDSLERIRRGLGA